MRWIRGPGGRDSQATTRMAANAANKPLRIITLTPLQLTACHERVKLGQSKGSAEGLRR